MIDTGTVVRYVARCDSCGTRHHDLDDGFISAAGATTIAVACGWKLNEDSTKIVCTACSHQEPSP